MSRALNPPRPARCTPRPPEARHIRTFAEHAALENIELHIQARRAELRSMERHIEWLENLRATRQQQIAAGVWPRPAAASPPNHQGDTVKIYTLTMRVEAEDDVNAEQIREELYDATNNVGFGFDITEVREETV